MLPKAMFSRTLSTSTSALRMNIVVILSGGMDSTTLLYHHLRNGDTVKALSIDYGQKHKKEIDFAKKTCAKLNIDHRVADLSGITDLIDSSALTGIGDVPEGHYADDSMKATVVPNRNMIMMAVAIGWAINEGFDGVSYGAHFGDHAIYPDCRTEFADAMDRVAGLCDYEPVSIYRPFITLTKDEICAIGDSLGVDWGDTWSCYNGRDAHCGKCGTCVERIEAFKLAKVEDPTAYES